MAIIGVIGAEHSLKNSNWTASLVEASRRAVKAAWEQVWEIRRHNQRRVLEAFRQARISEFDLNGTTGYGYHDPSRKAVEEIYCTVFGTEAAIVRPQIVSGTHAIAASLFGVCRPGSEILSATGSPYDTLKRIISGPGPSLADWGITYREVDLSPAGRCVPEAILAAINKNTSVVMFQRSKGYTVRPALSARHIAETATLVKKAAPHVTTFVDNCYGEFVEEWEPTQIGGVDLLAGSLIKNPGGTLAIAGGYITGRRHLVSLAADAAIAPGLGLKVGPMLGLGRNLLQGFYFAPLFVAEALCGGILAAHLFAELGFAVEPAWNGERADNVQALLLGSPEAVLAFCKAVQNSSPIDSTATPVPANLPGYQDPVVMAAGTFVQGASSELSADAPMRPPYAVFMQGGSSREQIEVALETALEYLQQGGYLQISR